MSGAPKEYVGFASSQIGATRFIAQACGLAFVSSLISARSVYYLNLGYSAKETLLYTQNESFYLCAVLIIGTLLSVVFCPGVIRKKKQNNE